MTARRAKQAISFWLFMVVLIGAGCIAGKGPQSTAATGEWQPLFNGKDFTGWRSIGGTTVPIAHWRIEEGVLHKLASGNVPLAPDGQPIKGGDLMTSATYGDFELRFEWKISTGGNSGVKYNVSEERSMNNPIAPGAALGFEYQVLDNEHHPDAKLGDGRNRQAGALYDLIGPSADVSKPAGEWNESRIVFRGNHGEHWLNGTLVVSYDLDSPQFREQFSKSKYANIDGFATRRRGHIVLQDHNDDAWFRNIYIRELP